MLCVPRESLPTLAVKYLEHRTAKYCGDAKTAMLAYAHYAQAVERLVSTEVLYNITGEADIWFKDHA